MRWRPRRGIETTVLIALLGLLLFGSSNPPAIGVNGGGENGMADLDITGVAPFDGGSATASAPSPAAPPLSVRLIDPFAGHELCPARQVEYTFYAFATGGATPTGYRWVFGDGSPPVTSGSVAFHNYTAPANYTYLVTVTDLNGSTASASNWTVVSLPPCPVPSPAPPNDWSAVGFWVAVGLLAAAVVGIVVVLLRTRSTGRR